MNSLRCIGLLMLVLLSACDADKTPPPPPKVAAQTPVAAPETQAPAPAAAQVPPAATEPASEIAKPPVPVHELKPNVGVVPVVAASKPDSGTSATAARIATPSKAAAVEQKTPSVNAKSAKVKADNAEIANRAPVASKSKSPAQVVKDTRLPKAALDLSLPPDMVKQLTPPPSVITAATKPKAPSGGAKPILPKMFPDTNSDPDFQLQGRLLSNEMQLQLRNESRKEVEGAALDFKFKQ
ncbi:translation initiation factor 2 [Pseudomonas sp. UBA1879]|uniref:translation initiation factor 2 n=1 Tax=Pseudomonas sp. UBA1879 TaxID=1947305 RepID=UPI0025D93874|nr:translation initiation factor 2 [Pseudomonas sp. UBA1879]